MSVTVGPFVQADATSPPPNATCSLCTHILNTPQSTPYPEETRENYECPSCHEQFHRACAVARYLRGDASCSVCHRAWPDAEFTPVVLREHEARLNRIDVRLESVQTDVKHIKGILPIMQADIAELKTKVHAIEHKLDVLMDKFDRFASRV